MADLDARRKGVREPGRYSPRIAFKSSSAVPMGLMSKCFTRVSRTLGVRNAGSDHFQLQRFEMQESFLQAFCHEQLRVRLNKQYAH